MCSQQISFAFPRKANIKHPMQLHFKCRTINIDSIVKIRTSVHIMAN